MSEKIVVLDGFMLDTDGLSWDKVSTLGDLHVYLKTPRDLIVERCNGASMVLTNKVVIDAEIISKLPDLRYIGVLATGFNIIDINAAKMHGITVSNIPSYSTMSVAQTAFSLLLCITQHAEHYSEENRKGRWSNADNFTYSDYPLIELAGKKIGIIGLGHTGMATAKIAAAFGMQVCAYTSKSQDRLPEGYIKMSKDDIFAECDVISLHCPLNEDTKLMVSEKRISMMKPDAILINTSRGGIVDEKALADALNSGRVYAAGLDVLTVEPPKEDNVLLHARNCYVTPHIGWTTKEARMRLMDVVFENMRAFLNGTPQNVVNP